MLHSLTICACRTKIGVGICTNVMFLNPFQWGFQYPLIMKLRKEGFPLEGMCVAAGVPSLDNANEIIAKARDAGLRHISFKPGSEVCGLGVLFSIWVQTQVCGWVACLLPSNECAQ